jgi:hypothetical protein
MDSVFRAEAPQSNPKYQRILGIAFKEIGAFALHRLAVFKVDDRIAIIGNRLIVGHHDDR